MMRPWPDARGGTALLAMLLLALRTTAHAQLVEGRDFRRTDTPQLTEVAADRVEVLEFFSYGCSFCFQFQPLLSAWSTNLPTDVILTRVPVSIGRSKWKALARTYYALEAIGELQRLDAPLFAAINEQHLELFDEGSIAAWVSGHGVDAGKFTSAYLSDSVSDKALDAERRGHAYGIAGTPTLAVDGQYIVMGKSFAALLKNLEQLVDQAVHRKAAAAATSAAE